MFVAVSDSRAAATPLRSFRSLLLAATSGLVLTLGLVLWGIQYAQNSLALRRATALELDQAINRVDSRVRQLLAAAEMTVESGRALSTGRTIRADNLLPMFTQVMAAVEQRPELTFFGYGIQATGEYGLVERRLDGSILLRMYLGPPGNTRVVRDYRWNNGAATFVAETRGDTYDPRTRPHYQLAQRAPRGAWTPVYQFVRRFADDPARGITFARPDFGPDGALVGVWDANLDLASLHEFLEAFQRETGVEAFLYEREQSGLALLSESTPGTTGDSTTRAGVSRAPDAAAIEQLLGSRRDATRGRIRDSGAPSNDAATHGARYFATRAMTEAHLPRWVMAVALPDARVQTPIRTLAGWFLTGTALVLGLALLASGWLARRLARPLEELRAASESLASGDDPATLSAGMQPREIVDLRRTFGSMVGAIKSREADLISSRHRLQSHLDNTPLGVIEWNAAGHVVAWNAAADAMFGWNRDEMVGGPATRLIAIHERVATARAFELLNSTGRAQRFHFECVTKAGTPIECEWYITPEANADGQIVGMSALVLDVSTRLGAEAAFRDAEARFASLFRSTPAPTGITRSRDEILLDVNDAALTLFGYQRADVIGRPARELDLWINDEERRGVVSLLSTGQPVLATPATLRAKDGRALTVLYSAVPITVGDEACLVWVCVDLTERDRAQRALRASQALKTAIVDAANDAVISMDENFRVVEWNESAGALLGWTRAEAVGRPLQDVLRLTDGGAWLPEFLRNAHAVSTPAADRSNSRRDVHILRRDGTVVEAGVGVIQAVIDDRRIYTAAIRDTTARQQQAREAAAREADLARLVTLRTDELDAAEEQLRALEQVKQKFVNTVSHELRTPLTTILGFTKLLQDQTSDPLTAEQHRQISVVNTAAADLLQLVNDLLDVSRLEAGKLALRHEPVRLRALLTHVEQMMMPEVARKGLAYSTVVTADNDIEITSDRQRILQVLLNLIGNAVKFTRVGSVTVRCERADTDVVIAICDTGPGIPVEQIPRLFQPFESLDPDASLLAPGTGLGLYLVQRITALLGGSVHVQSVPGTGSCFTVRLPMHAALAAPHNNEVAAAVATSV
jgi:PAS domain S-box-containing protein